MQAVVPDLAVGCAIKVLQGPSSKVEAVRLCQEAGKGHVVIPEEAVAHVYPGVPHAHHLILALQGRTGHLSCKIEESWRQWRCAASQTARPTSKSNASD